MELSHNGYRIDTTLGDLMAAISDVAFEYATDTKEAYHLAHLVLPKILQGATLRSEITDRRFAAIKYLH